jgi:nucleoside-diphosphate-sugar epimerase
VHVRDAAQAISAVLEAAPDDVRGEVFNAGNSNENYRKQDLIELLQERVPDVVVERVAQLDDPRDYRVGFGKIESRLGYATTRTVPGGMDELIELLRSGAVADPFAEVFRN